MICWLVDWSAVLLAGSGCLCRCGSVHWQRCGCQHSQQQQWDGLEPPPHIFWPRPGLSRKNHSSQSTPLLQYCIMSTLCWSADSNQFSHLLFQNVGVVKPFETVAVIKSYTNKLGPGQLRKWLRLTRSGSSHRYAARILILGKAAEFNCPTNLLKQKLLTAYVFDQSTRRVLLASLTQTISLSWSQTWKMLLLKRKVIPILIGKIAPHTQGWERWKAVHRCRIS